MGAWIKDKHRMKRGPGGAGRLQSSLHLHNCKYPKALKVVFAELEVFLNTFFRILAYVYKWHAGN